MISYKNSLNRQFQSSRQKYQRERDYFLSGTKEKELLLSSEDSSNVNKNYVNFENHQPEWVQCAEEVRLIIRSLDQEYSILQQFCHEDFTRPSFNDDESIKVKIKNTYKDITKKLHLCQDKVNMINNRFVVNNHQKYSKLHLSLVRTVIYHLITQIRNISSKLSETQRSYADNLKLRDTHADEYVAIDIEQIVVQNNECTPNEPFDNILLQSPNQYEDFSKSIQQISSSIEDVNSIMRQLGTMVVDQGVHIDRIDHHFELASLQVQAGLDKLAAVEKMVTKKNWKIAGFSISLLVIILIVLIVYAVK